jgi:hypothetical protein
MAVLRFVNNLTIYQHLIIHRFSDVKVWILKEEISENM